MENLDSPRLLWGVRTNGVGNLGRLEDGIGKDLFGRFGGSVQVGTAEAKESQGGGCGG